MRELVETLQSSSFSYLKCFNLFMHSFWDDPMRHLRSCINISCTAICSSICTVIVSDPIPFFMVGFEFFGLVFKIFIFEVYILLFLLFYLI